MNDVRKHVAAPLLTQKQELLKEINRSVANLGSVIPESKRILASKNLVRSISLLKITQMQNT